MFEWLLWLVYRVDASITRPAFRFLDRRKWSYESVGHARALAYISITVSSMAYYFATLELTPEEPPEQTFNNLWFPVTAVVIMFCGAHFARLLLVGVRNWLEQRTSIEIQPDLGDGTWAWAFVLRVVAFATMTLGVIGDDPWLFATIFVLLSVVDTLYAFYMRWNNPPRKKKRRKRTVSAPQPSLLERIMGIPVPQS